jgi:adenylate cyclase
MAMLRRLRSRKLPGVLSNVTALALVLLIALSGLALWLADPIPLQSLRLAQFDQFQRWHPRPATPAAVRIVDIDEASLKAYGQWPWPRTRVAELVQRLHEAGAAGRTGPHLAGRHGSTLAKPAGQRRAAAAARP